jgi:phosphoribosylanthranilate isomerase
MTAVKICGLRRVDDALAAAEAGADLLGFVFAESRRRIDPDDARSIVRSVRTTARVRVVGVFVNETADEMNRVAECCDLDFVQLSGDEPDEIIGGLSRPVIRTVHMWSDLDAGELAERIHTSKAEIILLDTPRAGQYGGTGETFDWTRIPELDRPVLLAGGLHSGNVSEAVRLVRPWGVDVSSGVESAGEKDHDRIRDFIRAARS